MEWQERNMELTPSLEGGTGMPPPPEVKAEEAPSNEQSLDADLFPPPVIIIPIVLTNGSWYYGGAISAGQKHYYVLENVPFNSAKYLIQAVEWVPASQDIDLYVKFNAIPSTTDYHYKMSTANQFEIINVEVPDDDKYGDMYIMVYCVSGSGYESVYAHYVSDNNGCWRSADYLSTPTYGDPPIHISDHVDATDLNDFYKVFLYSGQEFYIDGEATSGYTFACYFYDENHVLLASDTSGIWIDIIYHITAFESGYYYVRFKCMGTVRNNYFSDFTDEKNDPNNRYGDAFLVFPGYTGEMGPSDVNDYYYFMVDSGEHITISITLDDPLSSPYYDLFLYSTGYPINYDYVKSDTSGILLDIDYYCGEYFTSEVNPGTQNKIYLRLWNAALHYGMPDVTSGYTIMITRSWNVANDRLVTAPPYTDWGNDTTPKGGNLNGEIDVNDWFKITTKAGYTIKIAVNETGDVPSPFLDGYLLDDTGAIVAADTSNNITITYTALYDGNYYFRLYEAAAQYYYGPYTGPSPYSWFIYTSAFDGNDNFTTAEYVEPPVTIDSTVSIADLDDYYQFEVPSGYEISLTGTCTPGDVELYLYDSAQIERGADASSPWAITYQHKGLETEIYYAHVHNEAGHIVATYSLTIVLNKIDTDGEMADATDISMAHGDSSTGSDSIGGADINDYYRFYGESGDQFLTTVNGPDDLLVRLVKDDGFGGEILLVEELVVGGTAFIEYFPNEFFPGTNHYLRICAPGGNPTGAYDYNVTRVEFDLEDGYFNYAAELEAGQSVVINGDLSAVDTN
ncbi:MAG: PPC domain-containing protein, partial [Promethearchaeota archaeon]